MSMYPTVLLRAARSSADNARKIATSGITTRATEACTRLADSVDSMADFLEQILPLLPASVTGADLPKGTVGKIKRKAKAA